MIDNTERAELPRSSAALDKKPVPQLGEKYIKVYKQVIRP
jgi:hypothetical protein